MNKAIVCMFDNKMVSIKTDIPYSISIKEYLKPSPTAVRTSVSEGYSLVIHQQELKEYLNLGRVTEVTAKDILEDVIKFMLDNEKVFQIN